MEGRVDLEELCITQVTKSAELQYQESMHVLKKRKLFRINSETSENEDEIISSSSLRIESSTQFSEIIGQNSNEIRSLMPVPLSYSSGVDIDGNVEREGEIERDNHMETESPADIMGNPILTISSDKESQDPDVEIISKPLGFTEKEKKKKKRNRRREKERRREAEESSEEKPKEPRIGPLYQCDMSVLDNGEGDRNEFIGEKVWDPSNVDLDAVDTFLQETILSKPMINQFEFEPFYEYIPATTIISQDKLLHLLMKFNYSFEKTKKHLVDQKLEYTDRGFAVRQTWKTGEIKAFEKALKYMFESEGEFDLTDVKRVMPSRPMNQICEFFYAWKHTKRHQTWKEETMHGPPITETKRNLSQLRSNIARVDYNDQTAIVVSGANNRPFRLYKKPQDDSKVVGVSNEADYAVYEIIINAHIYDPELDRNDCSKYITKKNVKTDKFFLEYS